MWRMYGDVSTWTRWWAPGSARLYFLMCQAWKRFVGPIKSPASPFPKLLNLLQSMFARHLRFCVLYICLICHWQPPQRDVKSTGSLMNKAEAQFASLLSVALREVSTLFRPLLILGSDHLAFLIQFLPCPFLACLFNRLSSQVVGPNLKGKMSVITPYSQQLLELKTVFRSWNWAKLMPAANGMGGGSGGSATDTRGSMDVSTIDAFQVSKWEKHFFENGVGSIK